LRQIIPELPEQLAREYGHDGLAEFDESPDALAPHVGGPACDHHTVRQPLLDPGRAVLRRRRAAEKEVWAAAVDVDAASKPTMESEWARREGSAAPPRPPGLAGPGADGWPAPPDEGPSPGGGRGRGAASARTPEAVERVLLGLPVASHGEGGSGGAGARSVAVGSRRARVRPFALVGVLWTVRD
jgi:hypothetical protein